VIASLNKFDFDRRMPLLPSEIWMLLLIFKNKLVRIYGKVLKVLIEVTT
jgi:hypothetical protein